MRETFEDFCNADKRNIWRKYFWQIFAMMITSRSETNLTFNHQSYWFPHLGRVVGPLIQDELFLHIWKEGSLFLSAVQKSSICGLVSWSLWYQHVPTNSTHTTLKILHRITNVLLWFHFPKELQWSNSYDECRTWYEGIWLRQVIHEEKPKQALQRFVWKNSLVQSRLWQCMKRYSMNLKGSFMSWNWNIYILRHIRFRERLLGKCLKWV